MAEEKQPKLEVELMGSQRVYYKVPEADRIIAEALDGELAILPGHTSIIAGLRTGKFIASREGKDRLFALHGGLLEARRDRVRILTRAAEEGKDIDKERAERALERAKRRLESKAEDIDFARARAALNRAKNRLSVKELS